MGKKMNSFIIKFLVTISFLTIAACAKPSAHLAGQNGLSKVDQNNIDDDGADLTLAETMSEELSKPDSKYEAPAKTIETKQATIHLQQLKMNSMRMKYDRTLRKFSVEGHAFILDDAKKPIADNSFSLEAVHPTNGTVFSLLSTEKVKVNSKDKPVVRARVTCLAVNDDDSLDCSVAVVDFIVAYQKKIYTTQLETKKQNRAAKPETVPALPKLETPTETNTPDVKLPPKGSDAPDATAAAKPTENSELQKEQEEDSVLDRYQGGLQTTNLSSEYDADDEIQTVIKKDEPKTDVSVTPTPAKTAPEKSPSVNTPPATSPAPSTSPAASPKVDPETVITPDLAKTKSGDLRPTNQAIGYPDNGNLRNATSLLEKQKSLNSKAYFEVAFPSRERYYATYEMSEMITRLGEKLNFSFQKKLEVSDISKQRGGKLSPHLSHQIGMDADLGYPSTAPNVKFPVVVQMGNRHYDPSAYSIQKTFELFKYAYQQPDLKIDRIFADQTIKKALCAYAKSSGELSGKDKDVVQGLFKVIQHVDGHGDHFHIRLHCTAANPGCRIMSYRINDGCN
jgi:murein endopeptidase